MTSRAKSPHTAQSRLLSKSRTGFVLVALSCIGTAHPASKSHQFELHAVSSRADSVSGADVLVRLRVPEDSRWTARLDGRDVTDSFRSSSRCAGEAACGDLLAHLSGLRIGENNLEVRAGGRTKAALAILNHPGSGPIFSGPHQQPFKCQTEKNGLGPALDRECSAAPVVSYYYKSTQPASSPGPSRIQSPGELTPGFKTYDPARPKPDDVAQTVTSDGRTVPYIVRSELGTINRSVYEIQFLHEPGQPLPDPWTAAISGWNGRLVYTFMGGCGAGYRQGILWSGWGAPQEPFLSQGYALATSTLNIFANNCNDRISAETLAMVKEHFIEQYGEPRHTIGWGGSGGAIQQYMIAQNYPGLLDGIIPSVSGPDSTMLTEVNVECALLRRAFNASKLPWSEEQKSAVSGLASWRLCEGIFAEVLFADPGKCDALIPERDRNSGAADPRRVRCDIYENAANILGRDPRTGLAHRPLDNTGLQYGLVAFDDGRIDAEQFLDLNERVGGYDESGTFVEARMQTGPEALRAAYGRGFVLTGGGGLGDIPIIDWRPYLDDLVDTHISVLSHVVRARLLAANGVAGNQIILVDPRPAPSAGSPYGSGRRDGELVRMMDRWLDGIGQDSSGDAPSVKVARNRPVDLTDGCIAIDGRRIAEPAEYGAAGTCSRMYPAYATPRIAAGAPLASNVVKCVLRPLRAGDYSRPFTPEQWHRLAAIFPAGVCDFTRPGIGQQATRATWQRF